MSTKGISTPQSGPSSQASALGRFCTARRTRQRNNCANLPASNAQAATREWQCDFRSQDLSRASRVGQETCQTEEERGSVRARRPRRRDFLRSRGPSENYRYSTDGKEATITFLGPGEFLGEECLGSAHPLQIATATAVTDPASTIARIEKKIR